MTPWTKNGLLLFQHVASAVALLVSSFALWAQLGGIHWQPPLRWTYTSWTAVNCTHNTTGCVEQTTDWVDLVSPAAVFAAGAGLWSAALHIAVCIPKVWADYTRRLGDGNNDYRLADSVISWPAAMFVVAVSVGITEVWLLVEVALAQMMATCVMWAHTPRRLGQAVKGCCDLVETAFLLLALWAIGVWTPIWAASVHTPYWTAAGANTPLITVYSLCMLLVTFVGANNKRHLGCEGLYICFNTAFIMIMQWAAFSCSLSNRLTTTEGIYNPSVFASMGGTRALMVLSALPPLLTVFGAVLWRSAAVSDRQPRRSSPLTTVREVDSDNLLE